MDFEELNLKIANLDEATDDTYWSILEEISRKKNWYEKVFDNNMVKKWHKEILEQINETNASDNFWLCIQILKATAQGTSHDLDCKWSSDERLCHKCIKVLQNKRGIDSADDDAMDELVDSLYFEDTPKCEHTMCSCKGPDSDLKDYVDYIESRLLSKQHIGKLKQMVNNLKTYPIDWHPWSNEQVRDIVHPSLYCYVKGVSKLVDGSTQEEVDEEYKYQWLPSDISINKTGKVKFTSYINNLQDLTCIPLIERTLSAFIPHFEKVLKKSLRSTKCQVIVKIGSTELDPIKGNLTYDGGSWHIEGMPYEHIAATGIHYLEVNNISSSFLEFRKPVIINQEAVDYAQNDYEYTQKHYGIVNHWNGKMNKYLGMIKSNEGASVVFPNSLQHRVKEFQLVDNTKPGIRTIIAFFLIDPDHRIISTSDVPTQQNTLSLEEAKEYREQLMFQRKYFVSVLNKEVYKREFSLCEH